jgi:hypothetical protein
LRVASWPPRRDGPAAALAEQGRDAHYPQGDIDDYPDGAAQDHGNEKKGEPHHGPFYRFVRAVGQGFDRLNRPESAPSITKLKRKHLQQQILTRHLRVFGAVLHVFQHAHLGMARHEVSPFR